MIAWFLPYLRIFAQSEGQPVRNDSFSVPGLNEPCHREGILRASKNCLIHNTLVHAPSIAIELAECPGQAEEQRQALAEARQAEGFET